MYYKMIRTCSSYVKWLFITALIAAVVECLAPQWVEQNRATIATIISTAPAVIAFTTLAITPDDWQPTTTWCVIVMIMWAFSAYLDVASARTDANFWNISEVVIDIMCAISSLFLAFQAHKKRKKQPKNP